MKFCGITGMCWEFIIPFSVSMVESQETVKNVSGSYFIEKSKEGIYILQNEANFFHPLLFSQQFSTIIIIEIQKN